MRLSLPTARRSRIALTSLVDVVFILLFFFMLAAQGANLRAQRVDLAPPPLADAPAASPPSTVVLLLLADGRLYRDGRALDEDASITASEGVTLVPGAGVSVQQLAHALDRLRAQSLAVRLGLPP